MLIGEDFDKIEWTPFGLDLVEPNAMIGDALILITSLILAYKTNSFGDHEYFKRWKMFFAVFGVGFLFGGLGHFLFNYFGVPGKYPGWYLGIISVFVLEGAMISIYPDEKKKRLFQTLSKIKLVLALVAATLVFALVDLEPDPSVGLKVPSANTFIGLVVCLGILGAKYSSLYSKKFRLLVISIFVLLPTAIVQTMKIGFYPWFDRNDISHIFLIIGVILYFKGMSGYKEYLDRSNEQPETA